MYSKSTIALLAALSTFAFAVPTVSRAEDQAEWLQRQLQMTDGYAPPPALPAPEADRSAASVSRDGALDASQRVALPARNGHRAGASPVRRGALRVSHPGKSAPQSPEVYQEPAYVQEVPACEEAAAEDEPTLAQAECADCTVIEPRREAREAEMHGEGLGLAAVGALLALAAFKVMKTLGRLQQA